MTIALPSDSFSSDTGCVILEFSNGKKLVVRSTINHRGAHVLRLAPRRDQSTYSYVNSVRQKLRRLLKAEYDEARRLQRLLLPDSSIIVTRTLERVRSANNNGFPIIVTHPALSSKLQAGDNVLASPMKYEDISIPIGEIISIS